MPATRGTSRCSGRAGARARPPRQSLGALAAEQCMQPAGHGVLTRCTRGPRDRWADEKRPTLPPITQCSLTVRVRVLGGRDRRRSGAAAVLLGGATVASDAAGAAEVQVLPALRQQRLRRPQRRQARPRQCAPHHLGGPPAAVLQAREEQSEHLWLAHSWCADETGG